MNIMIRPELDIVISNASYNCVSEIQDLQEKVFSEFNDVERSLVYPRSADFRTRILNAGGALYVVRDLQGKVIASLIAAPLDTYDDFAEYLCVDLMAGGQCLLPRSRRRVLTTALIDKNWQGQGIWKNLVRYAREDAAQNGIAEMSLGAFLDNDAVIGKAQKIGFYANSLVRHKAMNKTGLLFSANAGFGGLVATNAVDLACDSDTQMMTYLENYFDSDYVASSLDVSKRQISLAHYRDPKSAEIFFAA